ncbi:MAG: Hpt domain-containing protein [Synergistaceae bacterium]|jgi:signal transduction histidine kinase/HPt (histidine-containing phosphotransfer) domain-containing protein|nr:Hpt domain-containing protein [Synergistaceae bacterium]
MNVGAGQIIFVALLAAALLAAFVMYFRIKALNRRLEAAVAYRTRELEEQTQAAISAARAKSDFWAKMSHEIRTPMNTITGLTELILRKGVSSETLDCVADIRRAGVSLLGIINDILDFSEIESGKMDIVFAEYRFASLINDVVASTRMRLMENPLDFITDIDCSIPGDLAGDEARIRQVLMNLLSNAIKYTKAGCVTFTAALDGAPENGQAKLIFKVADTGIGIREEDMGRLFGDFVQLDSHKNRGVKGTGLGLAIARSLCRGMGGDITVKSVYGAGSVFTATISQRVLNLDPVASVKDAQAKHVLAYESQELYAGSLERSLKALGVRYFMARDRRAFSWALGEAAYTHVLANSELLDEARGILNAMTAETKTRPALIFMNNYGDAAVTGHAIVMPVNSISIAGILNDTYETSGRYDEDMASAPDESAPSAASLFEIDGLDVKRAIQAIGGSEQSYRELLEVFCEDAAEQLDILQEVPDDKNMRFFIIRVHALKSAAASVGAFSLSEEAARLEGAARRGDLAAIRDELDHFRETLIRLAESIKRLS